MGNNQSACGTRIETREVLRAAEEGNMAWLGEFVLRDINSLRIRSTCGGNSAWHKAAKGSQLDVIKNMADLLQRYFDSPQTKDLADERYQLTRIGSTAKDVIKQLINVPNFKGVTPLMHAAGRGNSELVHWLLSYGKHLSQDKQSLACSSCRYICFCAQHGCEAAFARPDYRTGVCVSTRASTGCWNEQQTVGLLRSPPKVNQQATVAESMTHVV